jgi:hypothetical protein
MMNSIHLTTKGFPCSLGANQNQPGSVVMSMRRAQAETSVNQKTGNFAQILLGTAGRIFFEEVPEATSLETEWL